MYNEKEILKDLKKERKALEDKLVKVNRAILALEPVTLQMMEWKKKALSCMTGFECYTQTVDILECVFFDTPEILEDDVQRRRHLTALSVALGDLVKTNQLRVFKLYRVKGSFYGFPEWFAKDGSLLKKYYSKKSYLADINWAELLMIDKEIAA